MVLFTVTSTLLIFEDTKPFLSVPLAIRRHVIPALRRHYDAISDACRALRAISLWELYCSKPTQALTTQYVTINPLAVSYDVMPEILKSSFSDSPRYI